MSADLPGLDSLLDEYDPAIASLARAVRKRVRAQVPGGFELVYDNYNGLVIGYGPTDKGSQTVVSITLYPRWVRLFFLEGASLPDADGLLEGGGKRVRSLVVEDDAVVDSEPVRALIRAAVARSSTPFPADGAPTLLVKSVSERRRPRRPAT